MNQVLAELRELIRYRVRYLGDNPPQILALGLGSRKNLCIHPQVSGKSTFRDSGTVTSALATDCQLPNCFLLQVLLLQYDEKLIIRLCRGGIKRKC